MKRVLFSGLAVAALSVGQLFAQVFAAPADREFIQRAPAIAIGSALASRTQLNDKKGIETVTTFSIEEALRGSFDTNSIDIYEPGGVYKNRTAIFPGVPRFQDGERYLLFLMESDDGHWHVLDVFLGKFHFATDVLGHDVVLRDMKEVATPDSHSETNRAADRFLNFIRGTVNGAPANSDYRIPAEPLVESLSTSPFNVATRRLRPGILIAFSANSYLFTLGALETDPGGRWCGTVLAGTCAVAFPTAVQFGSINGSACSGCNPTTAINAAFSAWNGAPGASVNYSYTGNDASNSTNSPTGNPDGKNTIAFEYDLNTCCGIAPFSCNSMGYSGILGLGGVSATNGTHLGPNGETFNTTVEGDVWMNQGLSGCTLLISNGDLNSAVTHEVGHTLGFRHWDQTRLDNPADPCSSDASLDCAGTAAIMRSFIPNNLNATLQPWDQRAVAAVYPGTAAPAAPTSVVATATTATNVQVSWSGSCVTTCHVYRSADHTTYTQVTTSATSPANDSSAAANTAYLYKVRAFNGTESADSNVDVATTVIFTNGTLTQNSSTIQAVDITQLRTAVDALRKLANGGVANPGTYTDSTLNSTVTIKRIHIIELRGDIDTARGTLSLPAITYTDPTITVGSTPVKAAHVLDLRSGVQ